ncbi:hypothetical protein [Micromonospora sp. NBRC 101691]|nr:hypothetical protein [Micromonospora sp. NBRC 101691]
MPRPQHPDPRRSPEQYSRARGAALPTKRLLRYRASSDWISGRRYDYL